MAKQTHRGGIRAGHPPLWDHLHLGVSSWRMKSRCLTFTLASRLVYKHIYDLHNTESYINFQPSSFCVPTFGGQCRPWTPIWRQIWNPIYRRTTSTEVNVKISFLWFRAKEVEGLISNLPSPPEEPCTWQKYLSFWFSYKRYDRSYPHLHPQRNLAPCSAPRRMHRQDMHHSLPASFILSLSMIVINIV